MIISLLLGIARQHWGYVAAVCAVGMVWDYAMTVRTQQWRAQAGLAYVDGRNYILVVAISLAGVIVMNFAAYALGRLINYGWRRFRRT